MEAGKVVSVQQYTEHSAQVDEGSDMVVSLQLGLIPYSTEGRMR